MALEKTISKYINIALADSLEQALKYQRLSQTCLSPKQKAVAKAMAQAASVAYNRLSQTIGEFASSKLGTEAMAKKTIYPHKLVVLTEQEIDEILAETYQESPSARAETELRLRELAQAQVIGQQYPKVIREAILTLAKHGELGNIIDTDKALTRHSSLQAEYANIPRGNPLKGGLVNKYLHQGMSKAEANRRAEIEISNGAYQQSAFTPAEPEVTSTGISLAEAIAMTSPKAEAFNLTQDSDFDSPELNEAEDKFKILGDKMLAILEATDEEIENAD